MPLNEITKLIQTEWYYLFEFYLWIQLDMFENNLYLIESVCKINK